MRQSSAPCMANATFALSPNRPARAPHGRSSIKRMATCSKAMAGKRRPKAREATFTILTTVARAFAGQVFVEGLQPMPARDRGHDRQALKCAMIWLNENNPYAAQWLRNLIQQGHLPDGRVDDRSILAVRPADLGAATQHHFFAGIGGWPYALELAGWPSAREVWTASLPCQPLSVAGQRKRPCRRTTPLARFSPPRRRAPPCNDLWRAGCERGWAGMARRCSR